MHLWSFAMMFPLVPRSSKWGCNIYPFEAQHRNLKKIHLLRVQKSEACFYWLFCGVSRYLEIIPVSKWLVTPIYKPFTPFGRGPITLLRGLTITMVLNHLQVMGWSSKYISLYKDVETWSVVSVYLVGGFNQPLWRICSSKLIISPRFGMKINKIFELPPSSYVIYKNKCWIQYVSWLESAFILNHGSPSSGTFLEGEIGKMSSHHHNRGFWKGNFIWTNQQLSGDMLAGWWFQPK